MTNWELESSVYAEPPKMMTSPVTTDGPAVAVGEPLELCPESPDSLGDPVAPAPTEPQTYTRIQ